jgi:hypothetical protein
VVRVIDVTENKLEDVLGAIAQRWDVLSIAGASFHPIYDYTDMYGKPKIIGLEVYSWRVLVQVGSGGEEFDKLIKSLRLR